MNTKTMGEIIRTERKKRCLTLSELALKLDISTSYLGLLEMDKRGKNINVELLVKIAGIFNINTDYLLGIDKQSKKGDKKEYEKLLTYYRLMDEKRRRQLIEIAQVLLK